MGAVRVFLGCVLDAVLVKDFLEALLGIFLPLRMFDSLSRGVGVS